ncbi:MAG: protease Do [Fibrobacteres bacterium]|nr:protease Do [Fibrobacterota bacterium]
MIIPRCLPTAALLAILPFSGCRHNETSERVSAAAAVSPPAPAPADTMVRVQAPGGSQGRYGAFRNIFSDVAKVAVPSVVSVAMERTVTAPTNPFEFFFNQSPFGGGGNGDDGASPQGHELRKRKESGLGSGFITDVKGFILTNNHVVEGAQKITVQLSDEREFEAEVVGTDEPSDLAVIRIKGDVPKGLVPLKLGDSDKLLIGEWVVAVGAPFGLNETVTTGIISAKGRQNTGLSTYGNFLQTDAAINPGNSGGPLLNLDGEVVGINTAIYSQSGGYMGIGFAIPVNLARNIMESLVKNGKVTRGWLGVSIQAVSMDMAEALGLKGRKGALIGDVVPGGPADKAGLKRGDVILKLQGQDIRDANDLMNRIAMIAPGTKVDLTVFRDGRESTLSAKITKRDEERLAAQDQGQGQEETEEGGRVTGLGMEAADLSDELRQRLKLGRSVKSGAVVINLDPEGGAAQAGIQVGDVILEANRKKVESAKDLQTAVSKAGKAKKILFLVTRQGSTFYAVVKGR